VTALAHAALLAAVVAGVLLMRRYPGHRTVCGVYVVGVLFLPEFGAADAIEGVPPPLSVAGVKLTKPNALALGLLVGSLLYDRRRWLAGRPRWFDLPVLAWCAGPVVSSVANAVFYADPVARSVPLAADGVQAAVSWLDRSDLYDGLVRAVDVVLTWGAPYCLGRLYVTDRGKLTELLLCVVGGAVAYVPFCLVEMALSPQMHRWVYGFHQHEFLQSMRFGGFRPIVFMQHGIAVGFWMVAATLAAGCLWAAGPLRTAPHPLWRGRRISGLWVAAALGSTAFLCKSTGALALGVIGLAVLAAGWLLRTRGPLALLLCVAPVYVAARTSGEWNPRESVDLVAAAVGPERADSLDFRLRNEEVLVDRALERPLVGWGGWGRWHVVDPYGKVLTVADGLWVIALGERGLLGLVTLGFVLLLPPAVALASRRPPGGPDSRAAAVGITAVILGLFSVDCLMNAMVNPVFLLLAGGLVALRPATDEPEDAPAKTRWRVRGEAEAPTRVTPQARASRVRAPAGGGDCRPSRPTRPAAGHRVCVPTPPVSRSFSL
jgi:hypothetical protein